MTRLEKPLTICLGLNQYKPSVMCCTLDPVLALLIDGYKIREQQLLFCT